jgi:hypothetical protein
VANSIDFPVFKKKTFFIIYGRDGSSHRPKDLGVVSASFIFVPVCSSREKKDYKNKSATKEAQFVPIGIPTI